MLTIIDAEEKLLKLFNEELKHEYKFENKLVNQQYNKEHWMNSNDNRNLWVTRVTFENNTYEECLSIISNQPEMYKHLPNRYKTQEMLLASKLA